jgi:hypothetical protein
MASRLRVSFDRQSLLALDNTMPASTELTDFQTSMILQAILLLKLRYLWEDMTDVEWQGLNAEIADVIEKVQLFG